MDVIVCLQPKPKGRAPAVSNLQNKRLALAFCAICQKNMLDKAPSETVEGESLHGMLFAMSLVIGRLWI
jgi:hypothetical protein